MTSLKFIKYASSIVLTSMLLTACFQSEYTRLVKTELAKGVRYDSLVFTIKFGDTQNDFFGACYDLNQQKLVTAGDGSRVEYIINDSLFHTKPTKIRMLFFPTFDDEKKIAEMKIENSYLAWAPWNAEYQSDNLREKTIEMYEKIYKGNKFITVKSDDGDLYVKLDGNRRIVISIKDAEKIDIRIQDILHPKFQHSISAKK